MKKRVKIALAVVFVATVGLLAWEGTREREPVYAGKSLTKWAGSPTNGWVWPKAVRAAGTSSIPVLLKMLAARETPWTRFCEFLHQKGFLKGEYLSPRMRHACGLTGLDLLGPSVSNAVPDLIRILKKAGSDNVRYAALAALFEIGPAASNAVPAALQLRSSTNSLVRGCALCALAAIEGSKHLPALTVATRDPDPILRQFACGGLACLGSNAVSATSQLTRLLRDPSFIVSRMATNALLVVNPLAAYTNGINTNQVQPGCRASLPESVF